MNNRLMNQHLTLLDELQHKLTETGGFTYIIDSETSTNSVRLWREAKPRDGRYVVGISKLDKVRCYDPNGVTRDEWEKLFNSIANQQALLTPLRTKFGPDLAKLGIGGWVHSIQLVNRPHLVADLEWVALFNTLESARVLYEDAEQEYIWDLELGELVS